VVTGWSNKLRAAMAHILPAEALAEQHKKMAAPGTAQRSPKPSRASIPVASLTPSPAPAPADDSWTSAPVTEPDKDASDRPA
jgi:hypothetical protein